MASTLKAIIPLSEDTTLRLTRNRSEWLSFLNTAGRNYKYTFHEQVLIYAQKPDATACATLEFWNKSVRRWVNKYAEGIALIDDSRDKLRLRYVFDVSDTNSYYGNQPYIWKPEPRDAEHIMEALSNSFGEQEAPDLPAALLATAKNAVLDNYGDYFTELLRVKNDSFLEEMDSLNVEVEFRQTLEHSIAYMLLTRCGYDAAQYISAEDFPHITNFNTIPVISILGTASTDISKMVLREVERTVKALRREEQKSGKKFAEKQEVNYHKDIQKNTETAATERSMEHEHHLQTDGRLQAAGADLAGRSAGYREVRADAESLSEETQASLLLGADDNRQTDGTSGGNRTDGLQADGTADRGDGGKSRSDGGIEGTRSDGVGRLDEQHPAGGGGTNPARTDLRIEAEQGGDEVSSLPPFLSEDLISEILCYDKYLKADRGEIIRFFRENPQADARSAYLKRIYNNDYTELLVFGGQRVGYKKQENGLCMWAGSYLTRTAESVFSWDAVQEQVASLIDRNLFFNAQPLPTLKSVAEQLSLFDFMNAEPEPQAEVPAAPMRKAFSISQQVIDEVLASGGNDRNSRLRICAYFKKNHRLGQTADFLQKEFGNDGKGFYIGQERITARYDEQGIRIAQGRTAIHAQESIVVSWEDAARRIHTLLDAGQYMPQDELDRVDEWERHDLAERLWNLYRDEFGNIPEDKKIITDLYPADKKADQLAQQLTDPKAVEAIAANISELIPLLKEYPPRHRIYHDPVEVYNAVTDLLFPQPVYKAMEGFTFAENRRYISDDEIDALLVRRGSGISEGKFRIYSFFLTHDAEKEKTDFLKKEYGIGGHSYFGNDEWHDSKGLAYSRGEIGKPYDKILLPWNKVVKRIDKLIAENRYMSQRELALLPEHEKQILCRSLYHFFSNQPEEVPRPFAFAAEYDTAVKMLRPQLDSREAVGAILKQMAAVLDNTADFDRHYPTMVKAYEDLTAYDAGTYSLFGRTEAVSPYPQEEPERDYDLGYGYLGNGLTVWDRNREENGDYVTVAHIAPDRTVTFYEKDLPGYIKDEIERVAATAEMNISATQTAPVFSTPPTVERDNIDKFWIDADTQTLLWQYYVPINDSIGQYVYRYCSYDLVREAAQNSTNKEQFFGFLASLGDEEVIEHGEAEYAELEQGFLTNPADFWNCTDETMQGLLQEVGLDAPEKSSMDETITAVEEISQANPQQSESSRFVVEHISDEDEPVYTIFDEIENDYYKENQIVQTFTSEDAAEEFAVSLNEQTTQAIRELSGQRVEIDGKLYEIDTVDGHLEDDTAYLTEVPGIGADKETEPNRTIETVGFVRALIARQGKELAPNAATYENLRQEYPDRLIGIKVGERLLFYRKDAEKASAALNTRLLQREIDGLGKTAVTGYEYAQWVSVGKRLLRRGHGFVFAAPSDTGGYEVVKELSAAEYIPIHAEVEIDGRRFVIDSVDYATDSVSLRDITFQGSAGFPIFRTESVDFVRSFVEEQYAAPTPPDPNTTEPVQYITETTAYYSGEENQLPFDVEIRTLRTGDSLQTPAVTPAKTAQGQAAPQAERINYRITDDALGVAGAKTRFQNNIAAIQTLNQIELEKRLATAEEQEVLSKYTGWGALPQVFDENNAAWAKEFSELQGLLSPEDYASARATTLNAHYTSPVVIRAIYQALENMGFSRGNVLEPACGIGNFFGMLPDRMQESRLFGVELDSITGRIAKQLYQKSNITVSGFEETNLPDSFFDVAIGNVPFGSYKLTEKRYDKYNFLIHDHFFAKAIDKVRPGGVIAFITSKGTMDKQNPSVRKYIAQRAELIGAVRLPNTAFKANAGTEVTSDIIFLQKRDRIVDVEPEWIHIGQTEAGIPVNQYFLDHPEMVLGEMAYSSRMYGNEKETTCNPIEGSDLAELLTAAIANLHAEISEVELDEALSEEEDRSIPADPTVRNFSYTLVDGEIYFRENSIMLPAEVSVTAANRIRGMIAIRDSVRQLIEYQTEEYPDSDIINERANLNKLYDSFTAQYGLLSSRANSLAFSQDSSYPLLCSLEIVDEYGNLKRKADMFYKRTIKPNISVDRVDTASEALAVSLAERARVDIGFMSSLTGKDEETLAKELQGVIFLDFNWNSDGSYTYRTADDFLSGNVREKLKKYRQALEIMPEDAKHIDTLRANVAALEQVQPVDLKASEISVKLGSTWLPPDVPERFMYELLDTSWRAREKISVLYSQYTGEWNITGKSADRGNVKAENTYGTHRINAYKIIEETLNQRDVRIFDRIYDADGNERRVLNKKETAIAQAKQEQIKQAFKDWIWKDASRRERLTAIYNERFNSLRPREYDGSHIRFSGINPEITLRKHQINAIAHIIYGGNTLLAHEVGAGKSATRS